MHFLPNKAAILLFLMRALRIFRHSISTVKWFSISLKYAIMMCEFHGNHLKEVNFRSRFSDSKYCGLPCPGAERPLHRCAPWGTMVCDVLCPMVQPLQTNWTHMGTCGPKIGQHQRSGSKNWLYSFYGRWQTLQYPVVSNDYVVSSPSIVHFVIIGIDSFFITINLIKIF